MDIIINVNNQRLRVTTQLSSFVSGTQEFIRFVFNLGSDWDDLVVLAQFAQNGHGYNLYLDEDNSVYLPPEIQPGTCTLMLYGAGATAIATTNYLTFQIDENIFIADESSTEITPTAYNQIMELLTTYVVNTERLEGMIALKADLLDLNEEIVRAKGVEAGLRTDVDSRASQADLTALDGRVTELEEHPIPTSEVTDAVRSEIATLIATGAIAEMTIGDGTIAREKVDTDFEATLAKADTAMQPSVYDPNGYGSQTIPVDPYSFAQAADTIYDNTLMLSKQFTVTDANSQSVQYVGLANTLNGTLQRAESYADNLIAGYVPFDLQIISQSDFDDLVDSGEGEQRTFYLIPKSSGGYDKWWYIQNGSDSYVWDQFGGSSTIVAPYFPIQGDPNIDYIIGSNGKYQYYKYINNTWCLIAGGGGGEMLGRTVIGYNSYMLGTGTPSQDLATAENYQAGLKYVNTRTMVWYYLEADDDGGVVTYAWFEDDTPLVEDPSELKDYYIKNIDGFWYHYRYLELTEQFVQVGGGGGMSQEEVEDLITSATSEISSDISDIASDVSDLSTSVTNLANSVVDIAMTAYNVDGDSSLHFYDSQGAELDDLEVKIESVGIDGTAYNVEGDNTLHFYDSNGNELENLAVFIQGGGGGGGGETSGTLSIGRITGANVQTIFGNPCTIEYTVIATDASGEGVGSGTGTLYINNVAVETGFPVYTSDSGAANSINIGNYLSVGTNTIKIGVSVNTGGESNMTANKTWTVNAINMYFDWNYTDSQINTSAVTDYYTPYGALMKTIYTFIDVNPMNFNPEIVDALPDTTDPEFDPEEVTGVNYFVHSGNTYSHYVWDTTNSEFIAGVGLLINVTNTTRSGVQQALTIPMQTHGSHAVVRYMTGDVNGTIIKTGQQIHDMVFVVAGTQTPIIATSFNTATMTQYNTVQIPIVIYDPAGPTTTATLSENGNLVSTWTNVDRTTHYWNYSPTDYGTKTLTITCGSTTKTIVVNVEELDIDEAEVTGYDFRFKASELATNDAVRSWSSTYTPVGGTQQTVDITFSNNFDWVNGGLHTEEDENGHLRQYFCVRAGTTATFNYPLFGQNYDPKQYGKNFKCIFKAVNCRTYDGNVLTCMDTANGNNGVGLVMTANEATLTTANNSIKTYYYKDSYIEFETNIHPTSEYRYLQFWMDGSHDISKLYDTSDDIQQVTPVGITVGSPNCDVYIYMMKAYPTYLTNDNELSNFIMDAPNAYEMVERYDRNDIMDVSGEIDYTKLANANPDLHVILLDLNRMSTGKKDNTVANTFRHIWTGGGQSECFTVNNACVTIQGTSSVGYLESAGNVDINFKNGREFTSDNVSYTTGSVLFDDGTTSTKGYSISENAIAVDYLNVKLNVASSENSNNACNADWYNIYQPWKSPARKKSSKARDTMEFVPGAIFIRDRSGGLFSDTTGYHFYGICDIGNSKKNNKVFHDTSNPLAVCMEVSNNTSLPCIMEDYDNYSWNADDDAVVTYVEDGETKEQKVFEFRYVADGMESYGETAWDRFVKFMIDYNPNNATNNALGSSVTFGNYTFRGSGSYDTSDYDDDNVVYLYGYGLPTAYLNGIWDAASYVTDTTADTCYFYINYSNNYIYSSDGTSWTALSELTWIADQDNVLRGTNIDRYAGTYTTDSFNYRMAYMLAHCEEYMIMDPVVYHFVFIESFLMTDNVAKNTFWSTDDGVHWELSKGYDMDTSLGNDKILSF